jgi:hypothetical protein
MKTAMSLVAFCLVALSPVAGAYKYPLQFTPNPGYRGLVVAGYKFVGNTVVGNCSYHTVSSGSGRGGSRGQISKIYQQTCIWDLYGKLLSVTEGAPSVPVPISIKGTETVYAVNANGGYTGIDTKLSARGFVSTPGPHYTWLIGNQNAVFHTMPYTYVATLRSDGDVPLNIDAVEVSALTGRATVKDSTCIGMIQVGATCAITVAYSPAWRSTPSGLTYDTLRINLQSNSGEGQEFVQKCTFLISRDPEE